MEHRRKEKIMKNNKVSIESRVLSKYTTWININLSKYLKKSVKEEKKRLTNAELKELRAKEQYKFLTAYIAAILSDEKYDPMTKTKLRALIVENINKLADGSKKKLNSKEYVPTILIRKEFSSIIRDNFIVFKTDVVGSRRPGEFVDMIDRKVFLKNHKEITELPSIDIL
jgi:hypothetical protein